LNIARIERGTALYLADFGPDSLPHETGAETLHDRVSFKKGCYLGQEVVARMNALGHPKQRLVGLRIDLPSGNPAPDAFGLPDMPQAVTGTSVVAADEPGAPIVGAVTSSCCAPMLSQAHIAFAMVKWSHAQEGTKLWVQLDDRRLAATARESLVFYKRA
jgi:folate-binding protein YgfZ